VFTVRRVRSYVFAKVDEATAMSALGQKQTFGQQIAMSALPPKATSNANGGMAVSPKSSVKRPMR
jgi:hypothetical protein